MDQPTAIIVGALITLSGEITAAIITVKWKSHGDVKHHIHEHRLSYLTQIKREPWIRSGLQLAGPAAAQKLPSVWGERRPL